MSEQLTIDSLDDGFRAGAIARSGKRYWRIIEDDGRWELIVAPYPCGCQVFRESRIWWVSHAMVMWYERPVVMRHERATKERTCRDWVDWEAS